MAQRVFGLAKLIDEANIRPPHRPIRHRPHLADEYEELAKHGGTATAVHTNRAIVKELRRGLRTR